jgi:starvation-inducible DNA-binding protein
MENLDVNPAKMNIPFMQPNPNMILRQNPQTVKGSGISLPHDVRQEMVQKLDEHNCALHVMLHQYSKHHWLTEGAESFLSLHHLLDEHREKTFDHIDKIGERIARLGGIPNSHPVTQHEISYLKHEEEGRYTMRDMLRNDLEHEMLLQQKMRDQINRAHQLQDWGTVEVLEDIVVEREDLAYHLYSVLEDDSLTRGMTHMDQDRDIIQERKADREKQLQ